MEAIGRNIIVIEKYFKLFFKNRLKKYDLNTTEAVILLLLYEKEIMPNSNTINIIHQSFYGKTQEQMIDEIHYDKAIMTRTMQSLENKGYVIRNINPTDNRSFIFTLTSQAMTFKPTLIDILKEWNDILLKDVPTQNIEIVKEALIQMAQNATLID